MRHLGVALLMVGLAACEPPPAGFTGYVEGEYVRIAAPVAGHLLKLHVARGTSVEAGAPLFELEHVREQATVAEAEENIEAIRAQAEQAQAQWRLAESNLRRLLGLHSKGLVSRQQIDGARSEAQRTDARRRELAAAQGTATARLEQMRWQLAQKRGVAPVAGLVDDTYFRLGEWVPAGAPVVSLLPPGNRLLRFFVPEPLLGRLRVGSNVTARCDGCAEAVTATITFIAPRAEFTPPVIYSREARDKLVFLVEARPAPADAPRLHPGQPVDVTLVP